MAGSSILMYSGFLLVSSIAVNGSFSVAPVTSTTSETPITFTTRHSLELSQCDNVAMRAYYLEIGCTPEGDGPCPSSYNCDAVRGELRGEPNTCRYRGRTIQNGEDFESGDACSGTCSCYIVYDGSPFFSCRIYDCFFEELSEGCFYRYDPNQCCPVGTACSNDTSIARCDYGGQTYYEGMSFNPEELQCVSCTCREGFNGTISEPWCEIVDQNYDLHRAQEIYQGCVPIFLRTVCFALEFRCPSDEDEIIPASNPPDPQSQAKCMFGALELNIGDKLSGSANCTCIIPPQVTCTK